MLYGKIAALGLSVLVVGDTRRFTTCGCPRIPAQLQLPVFTYDDDLVRASDVL